MPEYKVFYNGIPIEGVEDLLLVDTPIRKDIFEKNPIEKETEARKEDE